jgi:hypothetical protein
MATKCYASQVQLVTNRNLGLKVSVNESTRIIMTVTPVKIPGTGEQYVFFHG